MKTHWLVNWILQSNVQIDTKSTPPLWGSCRFTLAMMCFFCIMIENFMRFSFSMAMVCMTGTNSNDTEHQGQNIEVIKIFKNLFITIILMIYKGWIWLGKENRQQSAECPFLWLHLHCGLGRLDLNQNRTKETSVHWHVIDSRIGLVYADVGQVRLLLN